MSDLAATYVQLAIPLSFVGFYGVTLRFARLVGFTGEHRG